jgi:hypothetical protein
MAFLLLFAFEYWHMNHGIPCKVVDSGTTDAAATRHPPATSEILSEGVWE